MKLGFTGTRDGMTDVQRERVAQFLMDKKPEIVLHGDCIGADSQFHDSVLLLPWPTWIETFPCDLPKFRARRKADVVHPVERPKKRNWDIVRSCDQLLAAPKAEAAKSPRSGTWQTIRLALSAKKTVYVVWPDGTLQGWGYASLAEILGAPAVGATGGE